MYAYSSAVIASANGMNVVPTQARGAPQQGEPGDRRGEHRPDEQQARRMEAEVQVEHAPQEGRQDPAPEDEPDVRRRAARVGEQRDGEAAEREGDRERASAAADEGDRDVEARTRRRPPTPPGRCC